MSSRRPTINDVAAKAGVSRQTVTRAINDMPGISATTKARVLRAGEELGYRPNRFASNLARQKQHRLGLIVSSLRNPYFADLAADVLEALERVGWQCTIITSDGPHSEHELIARLRGEIDVVAGYFIDSEQELMQAARGMPVIMIDRQASMPCIHAIKLDFEAGMAALIPGLRARGSRRFGMIDSLLSIDHQPYTSSVRRQAFEKFVDAEARDRVLPVQETLRAAADAFVELIELYPQVDTVIAFNDLMAMGAQEAAHRLQMAIPERIRIVGIDGLSLGTAMFPALTTLSLESQTIAAVTVQMAVDLSRQQPPSSINRIVVPRPLWRASA